MTPGTRPAPDDASPGPPASPTAAWEDLVVQSLRANEISLVTYVPDRVLGGLIERLHADEYFTVLNPAREEEAVGIVAGACLAGRRGIVLMQTSGLATLANVLASLTVPFRIPVPMLVSERGTLGEFQLGQAMVCRTMRPILDAVGIAHHTIERIEDVTFVVDRMLQQAYATQESAALILSPLLTSPRPEA